MPRMRCCTSSRRQVMISNLILAVAGKSEHSRAAKALRGVARLFPPNYGRENGITTNVLAASPISQSNKAHRTQQDAGDSLQLRNVLEEKHIFNNGDATVMYRVCDSGTTIEVHFDDKEVQTLNLSMESGDFYFIQSCGSQASIKQYMSDVDKSLILSLQNDCVTLEKQISERDQYVRDQNELIILLVQKLFLVYKSLRELELNTIKMYQNVKYPPEKKLDMITMKYKAIILTLQKSISVLERDNLTMKEAILDAKNKLAGLEERLESSLKERNEYKQQFDESQEKIKSLEKEAISYKDAMKAQIDQIEDAARMAKKGNDYKDECEKYQSQIEALEKEIGSYKEETKKLKNEHIYQMDAALGDATKTINEVKKLCAEYLENIANLENEKVTLRKQLDAYQDELTRVKKCSDDYEHELEKLKQDADENVRELKRLKKDADDNEREMVKLKKDVDENEQELINLRKNAEENEREIKKLRKDADENERVMSRLKNDVGGHEQELEELRKDVAEKDQELIKLRKDADEKERVMAKLKNDVTGHEEELEGLRKDVEEKDQELTKLQKDAAENERTVAKLRRNSAESYNYKQELEELRKELDEKDEEMMKLRNRAEENERVMVKFRNGAEGHEQQLEQLKKDVAEKDQELIQLRKDAAENERTAAKLRRNSAESCNYKQELEELKKELDEKDEELMKLRKRAEENERVVAKFRNGTEGHEQELEQLKKDVAEKDQELIKLRQDAAENEKELNGYKETILRMEQRLSESKTSQVEQAEKKEILDLCAEYVEKIRTLEKENLSYKEKLMPMDQHVSEEERTKTLQESIQTEQPVLKEVKTQQDNEYEQKAAQIERVCYCKETYFQFQPDQKQETVQTEVKPYREIPVQSEHYSQQEMVQTDPRYSRSVLVQLHLQLQQETVQTDVPHYREMPTQQDDDRVFYSQMVQTDELLIRESFTEPADGVSRNTYVQCDAARKEIKSLTQLCEKYVLKIEALQEEIALYKETQGKLEHDGDLLKELEMFERQHEQTVMQLELLRNELQKTKMDHQMCMERIKVLGDENMLLKEQLLQDSLSSNNRVKLSSGMDTSSTYHSPRPTTPCNSHNLGADVSVNTDTTWSRLVTCQDLPHCVNTGINTTPIQCKDFGQVTTPRTRSTGISIGLMESPSATNIAISRKKERPGFDTFTSANSYVDAKPHVTAIDVETVTSGKGQTMEVLELLGPKKLQVERPKKFSLDKKWLKQKPAQLLAAKPKSKLKGMVDFEFEQHVRRDIVTVPLTAEEFQRQLDAVSLPKTSRSSTPLIYDKSHALSTKSSTPNAVSSGMLDDVLDNDYTLHTRSPSLYDTTHVETNRKNRRIAFSTAPPLKCSRTSSCEVVYKSDKNIGSPMETEFGCNPCRNSNCLNCMNRATTARSLEYANERTQVAPRCHGICTQCSNPVCNQMCQARRETDVFATQVAFPPKAICTACTNTACDTPCQVEAEQIDKSTMGGGEKYTIYSQTNRFPLKNQFNQTHTTQSESMFYERQTSPTQDLQNVVNDLNESVSRIIEKSPNEKETRLKIAQLEEQLRGVNTKLKVIRNKDEMIKIQGDTLNIVQIELQALKEKEREVEYERRRRDREVENLRMTIQQMEKAIKNKQLNTDNLQCAVDLYTNSVKVLELSEERYKTEITQQRTTIVNLQDALVSTKQELEELRQKFKQDLDHKCELLNILDVNIKDLENQCLHYYNQILIYANTAEHLRDDNLDLEVSRNNLVQDVSLLESILLKYQHEDRLSEFVVNLKEEVTRLKYENQINSVKISTLQNDVSFYMGQTQGVKNVLKKIIGNCECEEEVEEEEEQSNCGDEENVIAIAQEVDRMVAGLQCQIGLAISTLDREQKINHVNAERIDELQNIISVKNLEIKRAIDANNDMKVKYEAVASRSRKLEEAVKELQEHLAGSELDQQFHEQKVDICHEELDICLNNLNCVKQKLRCQCQMMSQKVKELTELKADFKVQSNNTEMYKRDLECTRIRYREEVIELKHLIRDLTDKLNSAEQKNNGLNEEIKHAQTQLVEMTQHETKLQQETAAKEQEFNKQMHIWQTEESRLLELVASLEEQLQHTQDDLAGRSVQIDAAKSKIQQMSTDVHMRYQMGQEELVAAKNEINHLRQAHEKLRLENEKLLQQLQMLKTNVHQHENLNSTVKMQLDKCMCDLKRIEADKYYLEQKNEKLVEELDKLQTVLRNRCENLMYLEEELQVLKSNRDEIRKESHHVVCNVRAWLEEQKKINDQLKEKLIKKNALIVKYQQEQGGNGCPCAPGCKEAGLRELVRQRGGGTAEPTSFWGNKSSTKPPYPGPWSLGSRGSDSDSPRSSICSNSEWCEYDEAECTTTPMDEPGTHVWIHRVESMTEELQRSNRYWKKKISDSEFMVSKDK